VVRAPGYRPRDLGFDSWRYQIFREVVGLERGPLGLVSKIEELLGRKSSGSCLGSREYGLRDPSRWPRGTLYLQKLALTSPTSGGGSVRILRSQTQAAEFFFCRNKANWYKCCTKISYYYVEKNTIVGDCKMHKEVHGIMENDKR
jgi:hypothetical protein